MKRKVSVTVDWKAPDLGKKILRANQKAHLTVMGSPMGHRLEKALESPLAYCLVGCWEE